MTVEPEALAEWSAHARRTGASLDARLTALDRDLAPLARAWHGAAADGFAARQRQCRHAAAGLVRTLNLLASLVETAGGNYRAAAATNHRTWHTVSALVVEAMAAGWGRHPGGRRGHPGGGPGPDRRFGRPGGGMDHAGRRAHRIGRDGRRRRRRAAFGADYDVMAAAAWQGWRRCDLMIDGIAGGLASTGNNLAAAEADSTTGPKRPFIEITASTTPVPAPALPPTAGGDAGGPVAEYAYWPTADPGRLRTAAATWRWSAAGLRDTVHRVFGAVEGLVQASPDLALREMRRFTRAALSDDPTSGLTGVLAGRAGASRRPARGSRS